jgi:hypothetical protein
VGTAKLKRSLLGEVQKLVPPKVAQTGTFAMESRGLVHTRDLGTDSWIVAPSEIETLIDVDDLAEAMARSTFATESANSPTPDIDMSNLAPAIRQIERIVTEIYGPDARINVQLDSAEDTGSPELLVQAEYPAPSTESDLLARNDELMHRFATELAPDARRQMVLVPAPF